MGRQSPPAVAHWGLTAAPASSRVFIHVCSFPLKASRSHLPPLTTPWEIPEVPSLATFSSDLSSPPLSPPHRSPTWRK